MARVHKSTASEEPLTAAEVKHRLVLDGLVDGKSLTQATLDAGYSESTARQASRAIMPHIRDAFREIMHRKISPNKLSDTIAAGLDAEETKVFSTKMGVVYSDPLIAWSERREYAKLAANLMDFEPVKRLGGEDGGALKVLLVTENVGSPK